MKRKTLLGIVCLSLMAASIMTWINHVDAVESRAGEPSFTLSVSSDKQAYMLGEPINLNFALTNVGDAPVRLTLNPDVYTGYLKVWIAFSGSNFEQYRNSSWGLRESGGKSLQPGQLFKSEASVFWNSKPQIPRQGEGKIPTDYAFPKAGAYLIKAIASISDKNSQGGLMKVESQPIQIIVNEPVGDELEIWNEIKDNGEIAYFIQNGAFLTSKDEEEEKLVGRVRQIVQDYPNSFLAGQMKGKLETFRTNKERRTEILEKAKVKPNN